MTKKTWVMMGMSVFLVSAPAAADMVEIRGEGFVNGEVLSETDTALEFKPTGGSARSIPKNDVLYVEREKKQDALTAAGKKISQAATGATRKLKLPALDPPPAARTAPRTEAAPSGVHKAVEQASLAQRLSAKAQVDQMRAQRRIAQGYGSVGMDTHIEEIPENSQDWDNRLLDKYRASGTSSSDENRYTNI